MADSFIFYSGYEAYKTFLAPQARRLFIQTLCLMINDSAVNQELIDICVRVLTKIYDEHSPVFKQIPIFRSIFSKTFYFKCQSTFTYSNKPECEVYPNPINIIMKNSSVTNLIINVGTNNMRDVQMIANNLTGIDYQVISESLPTLQIARACNICDVQLITKRLRFECCDHLKFCLKCAEEILKNCQKCARNSIKSSETGNFSCFLCQNNMITKRLQFECCSQKQFCLNCAKILKNCPKC